MNTGIRVARKNDYASIDQVINLAFKQKEEGQLVKRLRQTPEFIPELEIIAIQNQTIVGHILYSRVTIGISDCKAVALAPMSVLPDIQKQGVGSKLIDLSLIEVEKLGYDGVIVLGHPGYYPRFGFKPASLWGIKFPQQVPDDVFMALSFTNDGLKHCNGIVNYSPAFGIS